MSRCIRKLILLMLITALWRIGTAQDSSFPIAAWKAKLSVKKDLASINRREVYASLMALDSVRRCTAVQLLNDKVTQGNVRFKIRLNIIIGVYSGETRICPDISSQMELLEEALHLAYEIEDPLLAGEINSHLGDWYSSKQQYGMAIMYKMIARDLRDKIGPVSFPDVAIELYVLGDLLYKTRDYREAIRIIGEAIDYHGSMDVNRADSLSDYWAMNAWNNMGLSYEKLEEYDSATLAFNQAFRMTAGEENTTFWRGLIKGNIGDIFFLQGRYDSAEALLKTDYEQSLIVGEFYNAALSLSRLAIIYNSRGDHSRALEMVREADLLERRIRNPNTRANVLFAYALIYKDLNQADSTFVYMDKYQKLKVQIEQNMAFNHKEVVNLRLDNQAGVHKILLLSKEKRRITLIRNFSMAFILLTGMLVFLYIRHSDLEKRKMEAEAESAKKQLELFTKHIVEKTNLVDNLQSRLIEREFNKDQNQIIAELSHHSILTDEDWEKFKALFEKVYPGFFYNLKIKAPDITLAEQRIAALIKLQLSIKESAALLGISPNSVYKARNRLKQRLGLEFDPDQEQPPFLPDLL